MNGRLLLTVLTGAVLAGSGTAQEMRQRAMRIPGGDAQGGRCVASITVDGGAELSVSGDTASVRNLSGGEPQWRRFECTGPMPADAEVRVNIDGRGRAQLVSSPRNGSPAVVRIADPEGGPATYRVELLWSGNDAAVYRGDRGRRGSAGSQQAIRVCRDAVRQEAVNRFGTNDVNFKRIDVDNDPSRRDWVVGMIGVRQWWQEEQYPFSCSVNLENGHVRSAKIEGPMGGRMRGSASRDVAARAMDTCRSAVMDRLGERRLSFGPMQIEDRNGNDMVRGTASERGSVWDFSCSVNPYSGSVRDVDLRRK